MKVTITPKEMQMLERTWMARTGVPSALLMEHAAQGIVEALLRHVPATARVLFLCGPGNNGGDGFAAARLWQRQGGQSLLWEPRMVLSRDALLNRDLALAAQVKITRMEDVFPPESDADATFGCPADYPDAVVDALFGTGLSHAIVDDEFLRAIAAVNGLRETGVPVIAADIPSGIDGLTGEVRGMALHADETVCFHRIKPGLLLGEGPAHAGKITMKDILIPAEEGDVSGYQLLEEKDIFDLIPPRPVDCHKGTFGRTVLLVGSPGMAGAAAFCAKACVIAGAGLTTILCRESLLHTLQVLCPEAMCLPLPEEDGALLPEAADIARKALSRADAACVGCGLGRTEDLLPLMEVFRMAPCPVVWDADALYLLSRQPETFPLKEADVITPHWVEGLRLLGESDAAEDLKPLEMLEQLHELLGCTVLLKQPRTLITDGITTCINTEASPALAKGGSGDVLAGVITALMARGTLSSVHAAALGALIHGLAGQRVALQYGENCLTPQRLIEALRVR